jgi:hypothetical protein
LPGDDPHIPLTFVSHDMCHVIGGYEPVGIDEIALGGMQLAMTDTDTHWLQFLGNLGVHEAGYLGGPDLVAKKGTLARLGATGRPRRSRTRWFGFRMYGRLHRRRPPRDGRPFTRRRAGRVRRAPPPDLTGRSLDGERA